LIPKEEGEVGYRIGKRGGLSFFFFGILTFSLDVFRPVVEPNALVGPGYGWGAMVMMGVTKPPSKPYAPSISCSVLMWGCPNNESNRRDATEDDAEDDEDGDAEEEAEEDEAPPHTCRSLLLTPVRVGAVPGRRCWWWCSELLLPSPPLILRPAA
jgi:hypothetical protein